MDNGHDACDWVQVSSHLSWVSSENPQSSAALLLNECSIVASPMGPQFIFFSSDEDLPGLREYDSPVTW